MATFTISASGPVAPAEAWERYADPSRWSGWSPQIRRVEPESRLRPGLTGRVFPIVGPAVRFHVDAVDEAARTWSWTARLGPLRLALAHGVEARGAGSSTWLRVTGPAVLVLSYLPLAQLALRRLVNRPAGR